LELRDSVPVGLSELADRCNGSILCLSLPNGIICANEVTISTISTGTESICLGRKFAPGTHWDKWVKYPHPPGYLSAGEVLEVGPQATRFMTGDRVTCGALHRQFSTIEEGQALLIPEEISYEEAAWFLLAMTTQNAVRKAEHQMGDTVVVIGLGMLGQLVVQYVRLMGAREIIAIDTALCASKWHKSIARHRQWK
jgi:D-arabinose 1-dehydrogenase-like Zn-dependent alcohol dehydrogenase